MDSTQPTWLTSKQDGYVQLWYFGKKDRCWTANPLLSVLIPAATNTAFDEYPCEGEANPSLKYLGQSPACV